MEWLSLSNHGLFDLLIAFMTMWHVQETCEAEMRRNATSIRTTIAVETNWFRKPNAIDLSLGDGLYHPFLVILGLVCDIGFTTLNTKRTGSSTVRRSRSGSSALYKQAGFSSAAPGPLLTPSSRMPNEDMMHCINGHYVSYLFRRYRTFFSCAYLNDSKLARIQNISVCLSIVLFHL